mmetsp:Transcript_27721/g.89575  ORF Transcript_27721/g.89575 Transcript_27721/m.89575 type:complete len:303 (-) Transcript_27721:489-1397(-)
MAEITEASDSQSSRRSAVSTGASDSRWSAFMKAGTATRSHAASPSASAGGGSSHGWESSPQTSGHVGGWSWTPASPNALSLKALSAVMVGVADSGPSMTPVGLPLPAATASSADMGSGDGVRMRASPENGARLEMTSMASAASAVSSSCLVRLTQRRATHACFLTPLPPKRGLSAQFWQVPQSVALQGPHLPQRWSRAACRRPSPRGDPPAALRPCLAEESSRSPESIMLPRSDSLSNVPMRSSMCSSKSKEASKKPGGSKPPELMWTTLVFLRGESPLSSPLARIWMQRRITQACFLTPGP